MVATQTLGYGDANEDATMALDFGARRKLAVLADGVGSTKAGGLAASEAVSYVCEKLFEDFSVPMDDLFHLVQRHLEKISVSQPSMATTLTVVRANGLLFDVGHLGDTRAYHLRGSGIIDLTRDQNQGQLLIEQGVFDRQNIHRFPARNVLYSYLAPHQEFQLFRSSGEAIRGDRFVIVSDGLYDVIKRKELAAANLESQSPKEFIESLWRILLDRAPRDDASISCFQIE